MITAEQIKQLSTAEKLQVMEKFWNELTAEGANQLTALPDIDTIGNRQKMRLDKVMK
ncbi:MAG TPA: hypothetical protein VLA40_11715 [Rheinheimera sp.]|nr:hypothetical protein [Rheinheimera sp.]